MRLILLLLAILMFPLNATAHEVKPPMKEACDAAKWLKESASVTFVGPNKFENYAEIYQLYEAAQDECGAYQDQAIDWAVILMPIPEWALPENRSSLLGVTKCE